MVSAEDHLQGETELNVDSRQIISEADGSATEHKILSFRVENSGNHDEVEIDVTIRKVIKCQQNSVHDMLTRLLNACSDIGDS